MAARRAALASRSLANPASDLVADSLSGSLHDGQRLANPGLSGFSSNSSPQRAQVRIGNDILIPMIRAQSHRRKPAKEGRSVAAGEKRAKGKRKALSERLLAETGCEGRLAEGDPTASGNEATGERKTICKRRLARDD